MHITVKVVISMCLHTIAEVLKENVSLWTWQSIQTITLKVQDPINWKTNASPSNNWWATQNCLQPALKPVLYAMYFILYSFSRSSCKITVVSTGGKCALQNDPGSPCYSKISKQKHIWTVLCEVIIINQLKLMQFHCSYHPKTTSNVWSDQIFHKARECRF